MRKRAGRTERGDRTAGYIVYDRRTGAILAVHHVTLMAGTRKISERLMRQRVRQCASEAIGLPVSALGIASTRLSNPTAEAGAHIDVATGRLVTRLRDDAQGGRGDQSGIRPGGLAAP
jgi:hypothetical protein